MAGGAVEWASVGERVALARTARGLSQQELADQLGIDRTAVSKIETGTRGLSALELAALASAVNRPIPWFLTDPPVAIASRRDALVSDPSVLEVDAELVLEELVLELDLLTQLAVLEPTRRPSWSISISDRGSAIAAAEEVRRRTVKGNDPIGPLAGFAETLGLYVYSVELNSEVDGLMLPLDEGGLCLINGSSEPGRRRATLAHEIGHYLAADEYTADFSVSASKGEREAALDAFAASLLLPEEAVRTAWEQADGSADPRRVAIKLAVEFRVSWSLVVTRLIDVGLIDANRRRALRSNTPTRADFVALGLQTPIPDLVAPLVPGRVGVAVMRAYQQGLIGPTRAQELLHGTVTDLPAPETLSFDEIAADLAPL